MVDRATNALKKKLGRDPNPEEVAGYLDNMVDKNIVDDIVYTLKEELGRDPNPDEVAKRLNENKQIEESLFGVESEESSPAILDEILG